MKKYLTGKCSIFIFFSLVALFFCGQEIHAQIVVAPGLQTNGCGAKNGWSSKLVPNSTFLSRCEFKSACDLHDICYSRCLEGGDLYGKTECLDVNGSPAKKERRNSCDIALQVNILSKNSEKPACAFYAAFYRWAVETYGFKNFSGLGDTALAMIRSFMLYVEKNKDKYTTEDIEALNSAITDRPSVPGEVYTSNFDPYSGEFELWSTIRGQKRLIVRISANKGPK